ncbi:AraC family transcriptional regulator [Pararobbsia alpina]|uniref:AraC family transcriptional regulator n=1 Tax=Pararobbsia alpina TaxID=621374 RepID=UPI0039A481F0
MTTPQKTENVRQRSAGRWTLALLPRQAYLARYVADGPLVGFAFDSQQGFHAFASDRVLPFRAYPNGLAFVPTGCDVYSCSEQGGEYLAVRGASEIAGAAPFSDRIDPRAIALAHRIRQLLLSPGSDDALILEELSAALVERAQTLFSTRSDPEEQRLTRNRLKRIEDLIEAHLDSKLTIGMMAAELEMSEGAFSRCFRASTGKSPYAHVLDKRIAWARELLAVERFDLAQIALAAGFSSHAHMTSVFRQRLGCVPSQFRR